MSFLLIRLITQPVLIYRFYLDYNMQVSVYQFVTLMLINNNKTTINCNKTFRVRLIT